MSLKISADSISETQPTNLRPEMNILFYFMMKQSLTFQRFTYFIIASKLNTMLQVKNNTKTHKFLLFF